MPVEVPPFQSISHFTNCSIVRRLRGLSRDLQQAANLEKVESALIAQLQNHALQFAKPLLKNWEQGAPLVARHDPFHIRLHSVNLFSEHVVDVVESFLAVVAVTAHLGAEQTVRDELLRFRALHNREVVECLANFPAHVGLAVGKKSNLPGLEVRSRAAQRSVAQAEDFVRWNLPRARDAVGESLAHAVEHQRVDFVFVPSLPYIGGEHVFFFAGEDSFGKPLEEVFVALRDYERLFLTWFGLLVVYHLTEVGLVLV